MYRFEDKINVAHINWPWHCYRLEKTQIEVEMEIENMDGTPAPEPVLAVEDVEEVMLIIENGKKSKSIRDLAETAAEGGIGETSEDIEILEYYRYMYK